MKGGTNLGRDFYARLNARLDSLGSPRAPDARRRKPNIIGKVARKLGTSARQVRRMLKAQQRAKR